VFGVCCREERLVAATRADLERSGNAPPRRERRQPLRLDACADHLVGPHARPIAGQQQIPVREQDDKWRDDPVASLDQTRTLEKRGGDSQTFLFDRLRQHEQADERRQRIAPCLEP
jgi:hypothetical protein